MWWNIIFVWKYLPGWWSTMDVWLSPQKIMFMFRNRDRVNVFSVINGPSTRGPSFFWIKPNTIYCLAPASVNYESSSSIILIVDYSCSTVLLSKMFLLLHSSVKINSDTNPCIITQWAISHINPGIWLHQVFSSFSPLMNSSNHINNIIHFISNCTKSERWIALHFLSLHLIIVRFKGWCHKKHILQQ